MSIGRAIGSPPGKPGKYALYCSRVDDDDTQCMVQVFASAYAARKFLDVIFEDDDVVWDDAATSTARGAIGEAGCTVSSSSGVVVSTMWYPEQMRRAVEHQYTPEELEWQLTEPHLGDARRFRAGPNNPREHVHVPREQRTRSTARAPRGGLTPVADLATELGVTARDCRQALRRLKLVKPASGWAWPADEIDDVRAQLKDALKIS